MQDMNDKVFGGGAPDGELLATEWNQPASELQNIIEGMGIALSGADVFQVFKALAGFVAAGEFYSESGAANAYVLTTIASRQGLQANDSNHDGALIRFRPSATNTGASTVVVNGLAAEAITREDGSALQAGDLDTTRDAYIRWDNAASDYLLQDFALAGSSVPNVARGYIDGFQTQRDGGDPDNDIQIGVGICRDDADTRTLQLTSALVKRLDANWAVGTGNGGFPSLLTAAADTWYNVFIIRRTSDGLLDAGFDTRSDAANLLTDAVGFTEYRRVASIKTQGGSTNIKDYFQKGDRFLWKSPVRDVNVTNLGTSATTFELSVPGSHRMIAHINAVVDQASDNARDVYLSSLDMDDEAPSDTAAPLQTIHKSSPEIHPLRTEIETTPNATLGDGGEIRARSSGSSTTLRIVTLGWDDRRGKN